MNNSNLQVNESSLNKPTSSNKSNRLKIAHRTRSKCPLGDLSLTEIESDLPDDLLFNNKLNNESMPKIEFLNYSQLSSSNLVESSPYSITASTPSSIIDPQDDLWLEFLNSLQESKQVEDNNLHSKNNGDKLIDQDDANDDPDFTLCLDNCDLEEPDYLDEWFQVPSKFFLVTK